MPQEVLDQLSHLPPWALYIFYASVAVGAAFMFVRNMKFGSSQGADTQAASRAITAVSSVQPYGERATHDMMVQTGERLIAAMNRLSDNLEREDKERAEDDRLELRELRRMHREVKEGR